MPKGLGSEKSKTRGNYWAREFAPVESPDSNWLIGLSTSGASHRDVSVEAHLAGSKLARGGSLAAGFRTFDEDRSVGAQALTQHVVHDSGEILLLTRCGCHEMTFAVFKQTIEVLYFR